MIFKKVNALRYLFAVAGMLLFWSCDSGDSADDPFGTIGKTTMVDLKATASFGDLTTANPTSKSVNEQLEITTFLVNIRELELELDDDGRDGQGDDDDSDDKDSYGGKSDDDDDDDDGDDDSDDDSDDDDDDDSDDDNDNWDDDGYYDSEDELELKGPFELDLLNGVMLFATVDIPNGNFEELEFEFAPGNNPDSELFGKTILIRGNLNGMPMELWHDFEEEVEIDFEDENRDITINTIDSEIIIVFEFYSLFDPVSGIDLSAAADGNGNGVIEISPQDEDGNQLLAAAVKNRLRHVIELLDD